MAIFNLPLPFPPAEGAFRAEGSGSFVSTNQGWIPLGYRLDMVLDRVDWWNLLSNTVSCVVLDTVDTVNSNSYAREEFIHTCLTDKEQVLKNSRASFNRNNGIHPIQIRKTINKSTNYKKSTISKMVP